MTLIGLKRGLPVKKLYLCVRDTPFSSSILLVQGFFGGYNMKKGILSLMLIGIVISSVLVGCNANVSKDVPTVEQTTTATNEKIAQDKGTIPMPDNIVFYNKGNESVIDKKEPKYYDVINLTKERIKGIQDVYKSAINLNDLKGKGSLLEFNYTDVQNFEYVTVQGDKRIISYKKLYFNVAVNDRSNILMAFEGGQGVGPVGPLSSPDKLINILNNK